MNGKVVQLTEAQARAQGVECFASREEAQQNCKERVADSACWACLNGRVVQLEGRPGTLEGRSMLCLSGRGAGELQAPPGRPRIRTAFRLRTKPWPGDRDPGNVFNRKDLYDQIIKHDRGRGGQTLVLATSDTRPWGHVISTSALPHGYGASVLECSGGCVTSRRSRGRYSRRLHTSALGRRISLSMAASKLTRRPLPIPVDYSDADNPECRSRQPPELSHRSLGARPGPGGQRCDRRRGNSYRDHPEQNQPQRPCDLSAKQGKLWT